MSMAGEFDKAQIFLDNKSILDRRKVHEYLGSL